MSGKAMKTLTGLAALMIVMAGGAARAGDYPFLDGLTRYVERIDTLSVASGDARDVNATIQIIDPWPPYARDRRIPANGQRMVGAINRYQNPKLLGARRLPLLRSSLRACGRWRRRPGQCRHGRRGGHSEQRPWPDAAPRSSIAQSWARKTKDQCAHSSLLRAISCFRLGGCVPRCSCRPRASTLRRRRRGR